MRRTEISAAGLLVPERGALRVENFVQKSKICGLNDRQRSNSSRTDLSQSLKHY